MRIYATALSAEIENGRSRVRADLGNGVLALTLSALNAEGAWIDVLARVGRNDTTGALQTELPEQPAIEVEQAGDCAWLILTGAAGAATHIVNLMLREGSPWAEIHELLILNERADDVSVDWFEAAWRFVDWQEPGEVFSPLLAPQPNDVIGRHVMRAPALTAQCGTRAAALVNDLDAVAKTQALPGCMNLLREEGAPVFRSGLRPHRVRGHVYFEYAPAPAKQARFHHAYHLFVCADAQPGAALDAANRRLWQHNGSRSLKAAPPLQLPYEEYARQVYPRMFERLWAETQIDGRRAGAIRENRSYPNDVWMTPWFNQARSAYGLYLWGKWLGNADWVERAVATRDLHLTAPQDRGLFPTVFVFEGGKPPGSSKTPEVFTGHRWVHSHHQGGGPGIYHLFDMSWTVCQLLRWHRDLTEDARTLNFAKAYALGIMALQREEGGLPAFVDAQTFQPIDRVDHAALLADLRAHPGGDPYVPHMLEHAWVQERFTRSAEDAASLLALAELARLLPDGDPASVPITLAALRLADWIAAWVYPEARWIDSEVYFSCSPKPLDFYDQRSGQWPQNTLCLHAAAAGFLALYELRHDARHLALARRALDRLSLYQQVWDAPFLNFYGFGGYGVMNTDGEWNDARQAQFADTHLDYYRAFGESEQLERAQAACRAAFTTVYLPANSSVYPTGWPGQPRGIAPENHAHGGSDHLCGVSGFDWGIGSALATAAYLKMRGCL
jgi:hypothetical protein